MLASSQTMMGRSGELDKVGCDIRSATALVAGASAGQLERRIEAQHVEVVAILESAGDGEHADAPRSCRRMSGWCSADRAIGQATGFARGKAETLLDLAQHQHAAVRRQGRRRTGRTVPCWTGDSPANR